MLVEVDEQSQVFARLDREFRYDWNDPSTFLVAPGVIASVRKEITVDNLEALLKSKSISTRNFVAMLAYRLASFDIHMRPIDAMPYKTKLHFLKLASAILVDSLEAWCWNQIAAACVQELVFRNNEQDTREIFVELDNCNQNVISRYDLMADESSMLLSAFALCTKAQMAAAIKDYPKSVEYFRLALAKYEVTKQQETMQYARAKNIFAACLALNDQRTEAEIVYRELHAFWVTRKEESEQLYKGRFFCTFGRFLASSSTENDRAEAVNCLTIAVSILSKAGAEKFAQEIREEIAKLQVLRQEERPVTSSGSYSPRFHKTPQVSQEPSAEVADSSRNLACN